MENENKTENLFSKPWVHSLGYSVLIFGLLGVFIFWQFNRSRVYIENSYLNAPIVNLSPTTGGVLNSLSVKEGDKVAANTQVAVVGSQIISTREGGTIVKADSVLGSYFSPGQTVVSIVNDTEMKVIGAIEETKGLSDITPGQPASFTVDAFPGKTYEGVLDQVSPVSSDTGVVFSISDKRPVKKFDVHVRFDIAKYPELKSGMSAKITVYTK